MRKASKITLLILILLLLMAVLFGCNNDSHEHSWGSYINNGDGTHYRICQLKSGHIETEPHIMSDYTVSAEPTDILPGSKYRKCLKCGYKETVSIPPTGDHVFDREVISEEFLYKKTSDYSAVYYKSCECGAFGNPDYLFESSLLPEGYSDIGYIKGNGNQCIDTGIEYKEGTTIKYNVSNGLDLRLPDGYKAVEYIESDGTQVMPTNIIISSSYTITADVSVTNLNETSTIWCSRGLNNAAYTSTAFYLTGSGVRVDYGISAEATYISKPSKNERFTIEKNKNKWYINGQLKKTCTEQVYTCPNELMFFASYYGDISSNIGNNSYMRMYSASVYDGKTPVAVFVPCFRESDKKSGLFDVGNGDFYTTVSGHNFSTGAVVDTPSVSPDIHSIEIEIPDELKGEKYNEFIKDYELLEYIESSGTQWIDTGLQIKEECFKIELDVSFSAFESNETPIISTWVGLTNYWNLFRHSNGTIDFYASGHLNHPSQIELNQMYNIIIGSDLNNCYGYPGDRFIMVNGSVVSAASSIGTANTNTLKLFTRGDTTGRSKFKLYELKYYVENNIIRDFIPVRSKATGTAGLYELVEGKLYSNDGEGSFIVGKSVDISENQYLENYKKFKSEYDHLEYIESTGTQYINTGYQPGNTTGIEIEVMLFGNDKRLLIGSRNETDTRFWIGTVNNDSYFGWNTNVNIESPKETIVTLSMNFLNCRTRQYNGIDFGGKLDAHSKVCPIYIFGGNDNGNLNSSVSHDRIYSVKISEGSEIIRSFVPARNKTTGEIGLYELIEGKFYVNEGTGDFVAGNTVTDIIPDNILIGYDYASVIPKYRYLKIYDALLKEGDNEHLLIPALRNSDSKIGMYDLTDNVFYTGDNAQFEYEGLITHLSGTTDIIKEATLSEEGMSCFTCSICGEKIYKVIPKLAFNAEFDYDSGVERVNVLRTPKSSEYEKADHAYTRNINSYNYSSINAGIFILPTIKEGFVIDTISVDDSHAEVIKNDNGIIEIINITCDTKITIKTKPAA